MKNGNRPIDFIRNGPVQMQIGTIADGPIVTPIATKDKLYLVMKHAIYGIQLADQIDPDRKNLETPNTQQQELPLGSEDAVVARILLTAEQLLKKTALGQSFDVECGIQSAIDLLKDIVVLHDMRKKLEESQEVAASSHTVGAARHHTLRLPSIKNIEGQFDAFAQKIGHVVDGLEGLAKIFYPIELQTKWIDALAHTVKQRYGEASPFALYIDQVRPFLLMVRSMRNMIEHPKPDEFIKVYNFRLLPSGELAPPSVEIVCPNRQTESNSATSLMESIIENLVNVCEAFYVYLCDSNIKMQGAFSSMRVISLAPEQRLNPEVRYSYGYYNGKTMVPISLG